MKEYYFSQTQLDAIFKAEDTILALEQSEALKIFANKLSLPLELLTQFFRVSELKEIRINDNLVYMIQKSHYETWGGYFFTYFNEKYRAQSWEVTKKGLSQKGIGKANNPQSITELFNKPEVLGAISKIKEQIVHQEHPLISELTTEYYRTQFKNLKFYQEQERAIREGVNAWLMKKHAFLFLGEMGVGKTLCTTAMVEITKKMRHTPKAKSLVVVPDHLLTKWRDEILVAAPQAQVELLTGEKLIGFLPKGETFYTSDLEPNQGYISYTGQGKQLDADYYLLPQSLLTLEGHHKKLNKDGKLNIGIEKRKLLLTAVFKRAFKSELTYAIWDESHLLSRPLFTPHLQAFYRLAKDHVLATGTSIAGAVVDLFPQAHAFFPQTALPDPDEINNFITSKKTKWMRACEKAFVKRFGAYSYNAHGRNSSLLPSYKAEIGVSSEFITHFILPNSIFLTTEQVWEDKVEHVIFPPILVEMTEAQKLAMKSLNEVAINAAKDGNKRIFSRYLQVANEYLDNPEVKDITYREELLWSPLPFQLVYRFGEAPLPKEQKLIDICQLERSQDRPVVIFVKHLDRLKQRLKSVLSGSGFKVGTLPDSVKAVDRQDYINKKFLNDRMDVMLINPSKVATGTDLLSAPTVLFFNTGFSYFEVGQAERRSFRIGQHRQTRVYYLGYKGEDGPSVQEQVLQLIAEKKRAMESIQGNVDEEGLSALLGKDQSSILNQLVEQMNIEQNVKDIPPVGKKQHYYLAHFGKELTPEDLGRPSLSEEMKFIWPIERKPRKIISHSIYKRFKKAKKSFPSVVEDITVFDALGEMSLFDLLEPA